MQIVAKRLREGQDLFIAIERVAKDEAIKAGVVLSAVGSLKESKIRVPVINGKVNYISPSNLEIDSVHGTVSIAGNHLHITASDVNGKVYAGHLKEGCIVRTTCELVIGILNGVEFDRTPDPDTGFDELDIK